ncbi:MAG: T9SS type A sorting domain-containing protein [Bacteroidota bacterium]
MAVSDSAENIYLTGVFSGNCDFDPDSLNLYMLNSNGGFDIFVMKIDSSGNFIWVQTMGGPGYDLAYKVHHKDNFIYVVGNFYDSLDVDPGTAFQQFRSCGESDIFISKFDLNGTFIWSKQICGTGEDYGLALVVDEYDQIYVSGSFMQNADFDPGSGIQNLVSNGAKDIFILKISSSGNFISVQQIGGTESDETYDMLLNTNGEIYVCGNFSNTVDFNPGPLVNNLTGTSGNLSGFIYKTDTSENFYWAKGLVGNSFTYIYKLCKDLNNNLICYGKFSALCDFDPGSGIQNIMSYGSYDIYVLKLTDQGDFVWVRTLGGQSFDYATDLKLDNTDEIYFCGSFSDTTDFDPEFTVQNRIGVSMNNAFFCKWGNTGTGIFENPMSHGIFIYPNPSGGQFIINPQNYNENVAFIFITDLSGKIIQEIKNYMPGTLLSVNLPSGIYIIRYHFPSGIAASKLIID